jgi:AbrB family looped-hinge helix DNA binding protein
MNRRKSVHKSIPGFIDVDSVTHPETMEIPMHIVTLSHTYQIVIPRAVCEGLRLVPGQKLQVTVSDDRITLLPLRSPAQLRGFLRGIDTTLERDVDRT